MSKAIDDSQHEILISEFITYSSIELGRSETTLITYRSTVNEFLIWVDSKGYEFRQLTPENLSEWNQDMFLVSGLANPSTRGKKIANLRAFFSWAQSVGKISINPVHKLPSPRVPQKNPQVYTADQLARLFASFDESKSIELRNLCMLFVTYAAALRASELINLDIDDIKDHTQYITINVRGGKGALDRMISIRALPAKILRKWLMQRAVMSSPPEPLFISMRSGRGYQYGERLTAGYFHDIIKKYASVMGMNNSDVILHKLRATGLTDYYNSGRETCDNCGSKINVVDQLELMRFSGHRDPKSLLRYVLITPRVQKLSIPSKVMNKIERKMNDINNNGGTD